MDDGPDGAQVAVIGPHFGDLFKSALGLQVVLDGGHDVAPRGRHGLVLELGLGLVRQRRGREAQAGGPAIVGPKLAILAAKNPKHAIEKLLVVFHGQTSLFL